MNHDCVARFARHSTGFPSLPLALDKTSCRKVYRKWCEPRRISANSLRCVFQSDTGCSNYVQVSINDSTAATNSVGRSRKG